MNEQNPSIKTSIHPAFSSLNELLEIGLVERKL